MLRMFFARKFSTDLTSKRALKDFYKAIHPDVLERAPPKVKEDNLRSLSLLNDYLDKIRKNEGSSSLTLKFYAPTKENQKSKKFLFFEVNLNSFSPNSDESFLKLLEEKSLNELRNCLTKVKMENNPFAKQSVDYKDDTPPDLLATHPNIFQKSSAKSKDLSNFKNFSSKFNAEEQNRRKNSLIEEIQRNIVVSHPYLSKPAFYAGSVLEELSAQKLEQDLLDLKINLGVFFVDKKLEKRAVSTFFKSFLQFLEDDDKEKQLWEMIQTYCEKNQSKLKILVSDRFEVLPTFVKIDSQQPIQQILSFLKKSLPESLQKRSDIFDDDSGLEIFREQVEKDLFLKFISLEEKDSDFAENFGKINPFYQRKTETGYLDEKGNEHLYKENSESSQTKHFLFLKKLLKLCDSLEKMGEKESLKDFHIQLRKKGFLLCKKTKQLELVWNFDEQKTIGNFVAENNNY